MTIADDLNPRRAIDEMLLERARALAQPVDEDVAADVVDVVDFGLGSERYAIEARYVQRLERLGTIVPLPGAPPPFVGITNLHGQLLPLVDLLRLLGAQPTAKPAFAVVIGRRRRAELGVVATTVLTMRTLPASALSRAPAQAGDALVRAFLPDGCTVVDGTALLSDARLVVGGITTDASREEGAP